MELKRQIATGYKEIWKAAGMKENLRNHREAKVWLQYVYNREPGNVCASARIAFIIELAAEAVSEVKNTV